MRFAFVAKHRAIWPVAWLCKALDVSTSGFRDCLNCKPAKRALENESLQGLIRQSFQDSDRTYGARRVWRDVLAEGASCGLHRIERLLQQNVAALTQCNRILPAFFALRMFLRLSNERSPLTSANYCSVLHKVKTYMIGIRCQLPKTHKSCPKQTEALSRGR
jgi:putative transposase